MKKLVILLSLAILLGGAVLGAMPTPGSAQVLPPPPLPPRATPWIGPNTPWVFYNGDWFLNGILYYFFGPRYGWAPYYAYPRTYIVRPGYWYGPRWHEWYRAHPVYGQNFQRRYPYWRGHQIGRHYGEDFYNRYHPGQGGGWHHGWGGAPPPGWPGGH